MTHDNQKALLDLDYLARFCGVHVTNEHDKKELQERYNRIKTALTAQPVTDDEVMEAIKEWQSMKTAFQIENWHNAINVVETLIRAATAPKNCDAELVKALEYYAQEGIYRAKIYDADIFNDYGEIARKALATHKERKDK